MRSPPPAALACGSEQSPAAAPLPHAAPTLHPVQTLPARRHVARAASLEGLQREMAQGGALQFPACAVPGEGGGAAGALAECWDEERFWSGQEGLVVFDGGSYSLGPAAIGSPPDPAPPAQPSFDEAAAAAAAAALEAALAAPPAIDSIELIGGAGAEEEEEAEGGGSGSGSGGEEQWPDVAALAATEQAEFDWCGGRVLRWVAGWRGCCDRCRRRLQAAVRGTAAVGAAVAAPGRPAAADRLPTAAPRPAPAPPQVRGGD